MLIDTLRDDGTYFKATLKECLVEARNKTGKKIPADYKTFVRREKAGIKLYLDTRRDPVNGWRIYTGKQIREIVKFETDRARIEKRIEK